MKKLIFVCGLLISSSSVFAADMTDTCVKYMEEVDLIIAKASENEATKPQMEALKTQMDQAKAQLTSMSAEQQDTICKQGIEALGQMKTAMGIK